MHDDETIHSMMDDDNSSNETSAEKQRINATIPTKGDQRYSAACSGTLTAEPCRSFASTTTQHDVPWIAEISINLAVPFQRHGVSNRSKMPNTLFSAIAAAIRAAALH
ncbi:hypothetical protein TrVFT333_003971 [Trichoderma virens FT-333]|nr:hypothetical protein TrVFT333_003971 [Trichoderma virens FT-333]